MLRSITVMPGIGGIADTDLRQPELGEEDCLCEGFSDAAGEGEPHTPTGGVGEAPRHEIAGVGYGARRRLLGSHPESEAHAVRVWHGS